jgi:hypothetical protein
MKWLVLRYLSISGLLFTATCAPTALKGRDTKSLLLRRACPDGVMTAVTLYYEDEDNLPKKALVRSLGKDCAATPRRYCIVISETISNNNLARTDKKITKFTIDQANSKLGSLTFCHLLDQAGQESLMSSKGVQHFSEVDYHLDTAKTISSVWCEEIKKQAERFIVRSVVRDVEQYV